MRFLLGPVGGGFEHAEFQCLLGTGIAQDVVLAGREPVRAFDEFRIRKIQERATAFIAQVVGEQAGVDVDGARGFNRVIVNTFDVLCKAAGRGVVIRFVEGPHEPWLVLYIAQDVDDGIRLQWTYVDVPAA